MGDPGGFSPGLAFQYAMSTPGGGSSTHPDQGMPPDFAMRPLLLSTLAVATACAVALICAAPRTADASTGIARCAMSDGTYAYTDTACNRLGGRHHALPAEVLNRIRRDRRQESQRNGRPMEDDRLLAAARSAPARRPPGRGCATTPRQLAFDLRAALATGDVNRIAESFDWAGMRHGQAMQAMARIERLGGLVLVDADYFDGSLGPAPGAGGRGTLQVILQEAGVEKVADFDVRRDSGCYFVSHSWHV